MTLLASRDLVYTRFQAEAARSHRAIDEIAGELP
jgi:hypothetical protein